MKCGRCHCEITQDNYGMYASTPRDGDVDLCKDCASMFTEMIHRHMAEKNEFWRGVGNEIQKAN